MPGTLTRIIAGLDCCSQSPLKRQLGQAFPLPDLQDGATPIPDLAPSLPGCAPCLLAELILDTCCWLMFSGFRTPLALNPRLPAQ